MKCPKKCEPKLRYSENILHMERHHGKILEHGPKLQKSYRLLDLLLRLPSNQ